MDDTSSEPMIPHGTLKNARVDSKFEELAKFAEENQVDSIAEKEDLTMLPVEMYPDPDDLPLEQGDDAESIVIDEVVLEMPEISEIEEPKETKRWSVVQISEKVLTYSTPALKRMMRAVRPIVSAYYSNSRVLKAAVAVVTAMFLVPLSLFVWPLVASGALAYRYSPEQAQAKLREFFSELMHEAMPPAEHPIAIAA